MQQFGQTDVEALPQPSIGACFELLNGNKVDFAVVPFENSTNGLVVFTFDLLRDWFIPVEPKREPATFRVVAEQFVAIQHYFLSNATDLAKVTKVYSHPQVWGQVTKFLTLGILRADVARIDTGSTAQAAEMVAADSENTSACICLKASADLYQLPVRAAEVEDVKGNTTRFLVLGHTAAKPPQNERNSPEKEEGSLTSAMFVLNHDDPGALCLALDSFRNSNINLTSINSRPSGQSRWQYVFFVEAQGDIEEPQMQQSIESLKQCCETVVVLGSFSRSWRYTQS